MNLQQNIMLLLGHDAHISSTLESHPVLGHDLDVDADLDIPDADGIAKVIRSNESQFHNEGDRYDFGHGLETPGKRVAPGRAGRAKGQNSLGHDRANRRRLPLCVLRGEEEFVRSSQLLGCVEAVQTVLGGGCVSRHILRPSFPDLPPSYAQISL